MLCLPKQFVHHSLPPVQKCSNRRDCGYPYKLPDLWLPKSPDLILIHYEIWDIIQQQVESTKVEDVKDLMLRMIGPWSWSRTALFNMSLTIGAAVSIPACIQPQEDIMNTHRDKN